MRSGIPGLSYRQSWGKGSGPAVAAILLGIFAIVVAVQVLIYVIPIIWQCLVWLTLTIFDFGTYVIQQFKTWRKRSTERT